METKIEFESMLKEQFRVNELKTALRNIASLKEKNGQWESAKAYKECLERVEKEFSLSLPYDNVIDHYISEKKNKLTDIICPVEKYRGTKEYHKKLREAGEVADFLEGLCYEMFQLGYNSGKIEKEMFIKKAVDWMEQWEIQEFAGAPVEKYIDDKMVEDFKKKMRE